MERNESSQERILSDTMHQNGAGSLAPYGVRHAFGKPHDAHYAMDTVWHGLLYRVYCYANGHPCAARELHSIELSDLPLPPNGLPPLPVTGTNGCSAGHPGPIGPAGSPPAGPAGAPVTIAVGKVWTNMEPTTPDAPTPEPEKREKRIHEMELADYQRAIAKMWRGQ